MKLLLTRKRIFYFAILLSEHITLTEIQFNFCGLRWSSGPYSLDSSLLADALPLSFLEFFFVFALVVRLNVALCSDNLNWVLLWLVQLVFVGFYGINFEALVLRRLWVRLLHALYFYDLHVL